MNKTWNIDSKKIEKYILKDNLYICIKYSLNVKKEILY